MIKMKGEKIKSESSSPKAMVLMMEEFPSMTI
jgi:hypothetical protein